MPGRFARRRSVEVVWTRTRSPADGPSESVRVRRSGGPWEEVASPGDLSPELRDLLDGFGADTAFSDRPDDDEPFTPRRSRRSRAKEDEDELQLEYVWFGWSRLTQTLILAACGFFVGYDRLTLSGRLDHLLGTLAVAAGVFAVYWSLAVLLNRSTFLARRGRLTVRHRPLPMPFHRSLDEEEVRQLYVDVMPRTRSRGVRYDLRVLTASGSMVTLLEDVRSKSEAVRLERAVERHLGIIDRPELGN